MKKIFTLVIFSVISLGIGKTSAQQLMNLDAPSGARFTLTERTWPENHGQADVCLWNDDMIAATSITIDDNIENQHAWWRSMANKYGLKFTWFVIDENVSDWSSFQTLKDEGHDIQGHDLTNWDPDNGIEPSDADYKAQLEETRDAVNGNVTGANCVTYAYPDGRGNEAVARTVFISMRGTHGTMNKANEINYLELESASTNPTDDDKLAADKARLDVLLDSTQTLWNVVYYRGWSCVHFHTVSDLTRAEDYLAYVGTKTDSIWVGGYSEIAKYGQSRDTHTLNVTSVKTDEVKFDLSDQMDDNYFDFPLTVKIRVNNTWNSVSATQNGQAIEAELITNADGNKYVLVKAVPDAGETTVTGTLDASSNTPPVLDAIGNQNVTEGETLTVNISASDADGDALSFSTVNLPGFANLTDNGNGTATLTLTPDYGDAGVYNGVSIAVSDGTESDSEGIIITVNESNVKVITASADDGYVTDPATTAADKYNPTTWGNNHLGAGNWFGTGAAEPTSVILPFQLPARPVGKDVINASFGVEVIFVDGRNVNAGVDLYALPYSTVGSQISPEDYYTGEFLPAQGDRGAVGIADDFFWGNEQSGGAEDWINTNSSANIALAAFINDQYNAGAVGGDWIFIRLSLDKETPYQFVDIYDGASATPAKLSITFGSATAIEKPVKSDDIVLYPNPTTGTFNVKFDGFDGDVTVSVLSMQGSVLYSRSVSGSQRTVSVDSSLPAGTYIVVLRDKNKVATKKLIVK